MEPRRRKRYPDVLTQREILRLLKTGAYKVDLESGQVLGPKGIVKPVPDDRGYLFVRLYGDRKRKMIAVQRLVWLAGAGQPIPPRFEIHHRDEDFENNAWENLLCVHKSDHAKLHSEEAIPF
jgi:hypothetical protein